MRPPENGFPQATWSRCRQRLPRIPATGPEGSARFSRQPSRRLARESDRNARRGYPDAGEVESSHTPVCDTRDRYSYTFTNHFLHHMNQTTRNITRIKLIAYRSDALIGLAIDR